MAENEKPTTIVRVENGGRTICIAYTFKDPMDAIVWRSYIEPDFFKGLVEANNKGEDRIRNFLNEKGFTGSVNVQALRDSLGRTQIRITAAELMEDLHKFTDPKLFINKGSSWVQW